MKRHECPLDVIPTSVALKYVQLTNLLFSCSLSRQWRKVGPEEGHKNNQRSVTPLLQDRLNWGSSVWRRFQVDLIRDFQYFKEPYKKVGNRLYLGLR